jgi:hypothetical protein
LEIGWFESQSLKVPEAFDGLVRINQRARIYGRWHAIEKVFGNRLSCAPSDFGALSETLLGYSFWNRNAHRSCPLECDVGARRSAHWRNRVAGRRHLHATLSNRLQRVAREATKREQVYADFIMSSSKLLLSAYVQEGITLTGDNQHLVGLLNRMRLFAPPNVINEADAVIRGLIEISLKPSEDFRKVAMEKLSKGQQHDLLLPFSLACRAGLDNVDQTVR